MSAFLTDFGLQPGPTIGGGVGSLTDTELTVADLERVERGIGELETAARAEGVDLEGPDEPFRAEDLEGDGALVLEQRRVPERGPIPRSTHGQPLPHIRAVGDGWSVRLTSVLHTAHPRGWIPIHVDHLAESHHFLQDRRALWMRIVARFSRHSASNFSGATAFWDEYTALFAIQTTLNQDHNARRLRQFVAGGPTSSGEIRSLSLHYHIPNSGGFGSFGAGFIRPPNWVPDPGSPLSPTREGLELPRKPPWRYCGRRNGFSWSSQGAFCLADSMILLREKEKWC